jgi:TRAP-type C4-dicarboxylate transport system permease small subunit
MSKAAAATAPAMCDASGHFGCDVDCCVLTLERSPPEWAEGRRGGDDVGVIRYLRRVLERLLEGVCTVLMIGLAVVVVAAVTYRYSGASLVWYDEVAAIMLAWLTYYGAALAALRRAHLGFPGLVNASPPGFRIPALIVSETLVIGFFLMLAWYGWQVIVILAGGTLTSLPWVPVSFTQSVIPIGALLIALAEALTIPERWQEARRGVQAHEHEESAA